MTRGRTLAPALALVGLVLGTAHADLPAPNRAGKHRRSVAPSIGEIAVVPEPVPPPPFPPPGADPAPELALLAKQLAGTWTCTGSYRGSDGKAHAIAGTTKISLELGGAWLHLAVVTTANGRTTKLAEYRTFDGVAKQWTRVVLANDASHAIATSLGEVDGTWTWDGAGVRDRQRLGNDAITTWREAGGTKTYETTCKR